MKCGQKNNHLQCVDARISAGYTSVDLCRSEPINRRSAVAAASTAFSDVCVSRAVGMFLFADAVRVDVA